MFDCDTLYINESVVLFFFHLASRRQQLSFMSNMWDCQVNAKENLKNITYCSALLSDQTFSGDFWVSLVHVPDFEGCFFPAQRLMSWFTFNWSNMCKGCWDRVQENLNLCPVSWNIKTLFSATLNNTTLSSCLPCIHRPKEVLDAEPHILRPKHPSEAIFRAKKCFR